MTTPTETLRSEVERKIREVTEDFDRQLREIRADVAEHYVSKDAFVPIQRGFYAVMLLIVSAIVTALLAIVLKKF